MWTMDQLKAHCYTVEKGAFYRALEEADGSGPGWAGLGLVLND
jgi:hypothetical protein